MTISRRNLIIAASAFFMAPVLRVLGTSQAGGDAELTQRLVRLFPNSLRGAQAVGAACLRNEGRVPSTGELLERLCPDSGQRRVLAVAGDDELRGWISQRVRRDFAEGRTVTVQGWILAQSETTVYALTARA